MEMPAPAKVEDWVQSGMDKYVGVLMAEAGLDAQRLQRNAARSNHLPTVQLLPATPTVNSTNSLWAERFLRKLPLLACKYPCLYWRAVLCTVKANRLHRITPLRNYKPKTTS